MGRSETGLVFCDSICDLRQACACMWFSVLICKSGTGQTLACLPSKHVVRLGGDATDASTYRTGPASEKMWGAIALIIFE